MEEVLEFDALAGYHITKVCERISVLAVKKGKAVHSEFNGTHILAQPGETAKVIEARWHSDYDAAAKAYRENPQRLIERAEAEKREQVEREAVMVDSSKNEAAMREAKVPWPKTEKQLQEYIASLVNREHDYGTCVYAMSMAATAAFNYVAGILGTTGFQSSCADMDVIRRTRLIDGPFMLIKGEDALYPQYDLPARLQETIEKWKPRLKEQATKKLSEMPVIAHGAVVAHWRKLADQ